MMYAHTDKDTVIAMAKLGDFLKAILVIIVILGYFLWEEWLTEILVVGVIMGIYYAPILNFYDLLNIDETNEHFGRMEADILKLNEELKDLKKDK